LKEIERILDFIMEIEKLKTIQRKTKPIGLNRYENSAEHSWHVCLSALMLKDFASEKVDINKVIKMLLIHDLGEIDAGDTIIYESEKPELKEKEAQGLKRIFSFLPPGKAQEYFELWEEFEEGETKEARFAKAIDRLPPLLHNIYGKGQSWKENNISKEDVFALNRRIEKGSKSLWEVIERKLEEAVSRGYLE